MAASRNATDQRITGSGTTGRQVIERCQLCMTADDQKTARGVRVCWLGGIANDKILMAKGRAKLQLGRTGRLTRGGRTRPVGQTRTKVITKTTFIMASHLPGFQHSLSEHLVIALVGVPLVNSGCEFSMLVPTFIGTRIETVHNTVCLQDKERVFCEALGTGERGLLICKEIQYFSFVVPNF